MIFDFRLHLSIWRFGQMRVTAVHCAGGSRSCATETLRGIIANILVRCQGGRLSPNRRDDDGVVATASDGVRDAIHCVRVRIRSRRSATLPGHARRLGRPPSRKSKQCLNGQMQS